MKNTHMKSKVLFGVLAFSTFASLATSSVAPVSATGEEQNSGVGSSLCETDEDYFTFGQTPYLMPTGYKFSVYFRNPECMESLGANFSTSDDSVIGISQKGNGEFEFTAKKAGEASIGINFDEGTLIGSNGIITRVYDVESNTFESTEERTLLNHLLVSLYGYDTDNNALLQALNNNESISVNLHIDSKTTNEIDNDEKAKISSVLGSSKVLAYSDITLLVEGSDSGEIGKLPNLGGGSGCDENYECFSFQNTINVKWGGLDLGAPAEGYKRSFYVAYVHDGEATKIPASVDKDGNVVFSSGAFSTYAVAYEDVKINESERAGKSTKTPDTGEITKTDHGGVIASLIGCILSGITVAFTMMPRIRKNLESRKA